jgi:diguanylate cyclase (GGDEF)-like protein
MRGHAHPATAGESRLNRSERRAVAAAGLLLLATLATGVTASPVLPLLAAAIAGLIRYVDRPGALAAPLAAALALLAGEMLLGTVGARAVVAVAAVVAAAVPGLLWRREARRAAPGPPPIYDQPAAAGGAGTSGRGRPGGSTRQGAGGTLPREQRGFTPEMPTAAEELADLEIALAAVAARIGARSVILWDVDGYHGVARPRAGSAGRPGVTVRLSGDPLGWVWEQDMRLRLEHAPRWAEPDSLVIAERLRRHGDRGEVLTYVFHPARAPRDDLPLDEAAVYVRGITALQEARAGAAAAQRRLNTLVAGLRRIPGELEVETLAADLCATACSLTDATGAAIGVWTGDEGEVLACVGDDGGPQAGDRFVAPYSELALAVRADAMLAREAGEWTLGPTCVARGGERWHARPRALAALPLHGAAGTIGVLAVWSSRDASLDPQALDTLHALSPYAALHLEHARAFGRLREHADRDPLTLLRNRRAFDQTLAAETTRYERYRRPVCLLMLDIDHFKSINDQHGHEAGDEVLRAVSRTIAACVRDVDTVARFGGEEFIALLPETRLDAALEVAERIRASVANTAVPWRATEIRVTLSVGIAACPDTAAQPQDLIGSADEALYRAKNDGRNRVVAGLAIPG